MDGMDDLVQFLRARLDEDEQAAAAASDGPWTPWRKARLHGLGQLEHAVMLPGDGIGSRATIVTASWLDAEHIARHNPARVLAEVDAKRRILDLHEAAEFEYADADVCLSCDSGGPLPYPCPTVRLLALPYADHPDYHDEWRPHPA